MDDLRDYEKGIARRYSKPTNNEDLDNAWLWALASVFFAGVSIGSLVTGLATHVL